jgi:hypothetical protein
MGVIQSYTQPCPCEGGTSEMSARPVSTDSRNIPFTAASALALPSATA